MSMTDLQVCPTIEADQKVADGLVESSTVCVKDCQMWPLSADLSVDMDVIRTIVCAK